jgi:peptide-methionine (R)-S-oxide reductase
VSMEKTDRTYAVTKSEDEWRAELSPAEYQVLRQAGTERPYVGEYTDTKTEGVYALAGDSVEYIEDYSMGMKRVEVRCASCGSHLGHVFEGEGYDTPTDQRYCINSISMTLRPATGA